MQKDKKKSKKYQTPRFSFLFSKPSRRRLPELCANSLNQKNKITKKVTASLNQRDNEDYIYPTPASLDRRIMAAA